MHAEPTGLLDKEAIKRVFDSSRGRYGARKIWHVLRREEAFLDNLNADEKAA